MGWYILQAVAFALGAASSVLWYDPAGPVTMQQATVATAASGVAAAWVANISAARLVDYVKHRHARARHERLIATPEAGEGVARLDRQP